MVYQLTRKKKNDDDGFDDDEEVNVGFFKCSCYAACLPSQNINCMKRIAVKNALQSSKRSGNRQ